MTTPLRVVMALLLAGAASPGPAVAGKHEVEELRREVEALRSQLGTLAQRVTALEAATPKRPLSDAQAEVVLTTALQQWESGNPEEARRLLDELLERTQSPSTRATAQRILSDMAVAGSMLPSLGAVEWLQGEAPEATALLVVLWEPWDPNAGRLLAHAQTLAAEAGDLAMLALTTLSRDSTREQAVAVLDAAGVSFPVAALDPSHPWLVTGGGRVPVAFAAIDREVVWRGHPQLVEPRMIFGWLQRSPPAKRR